jgi:dCMP deaminase
MDYVKGLSMDHKWNQRWVKLAHEVASWSKDATQVGAVIVDQNRNPRGFGYNGIPRGLDDTDVQRHQKPIKNWMFEHAERNVLYACARNGISCDGCILVTTHFPCCDCTRGIIQSGITHVVVDQACMDPHSYFYQKWSEQITVSKHMLEEAGISVTLVDMQPQHIELNDCINMDTTT